MRQMQRTIMFVFFIIYYHFTLLLFLLFPYTCIICFKMIYYI